MSDRLFELPRNMPQDDWRCSDCGEWKPKNGRTKNGIYVDGTQNYYRLCLVCNQDQKNVTRGTQADAFRAKKMVEQEGCCAVCGRHHTELKHGLCIDHDHVTGHRRALLCNDCNTGEGYGRSDPFLFDLLAAYCAAHTAQGDS